MQGDVFFEMIQYARARQIWVRTTTNASLLHAKDNYRKLVDSGVNEIQIVHNANEIRCAADKSSGTQIARYSGSRRTAPGIGRPVLDAAATVSVNAPPRQLRRGG